MAAAIDGAVISSNHTLACQPSIHAPQCSRENTVSMEEFADGPIAGSSCHRYRGR